MKILKRLIFICLVIIIIFFLIDCSMQKVAEGRDGYTRSNIWAYYLYTDKDIRSAQGQLNLIILYLQLRTGVSQEKVVLSIGMMFVYLTLKIISLP